MLEGDKAMCTVLGSRSNQKDWHRGHLPLVFKEKTHFISVEDSSGILE